MPPKRKAEDALDSAPKGKKTTMSTKTTVTTVTIEEPEKKKKNSKSNSTATTMASKSNKSSDAAFPFGSYHPSSGFPTPNFTGPPSNYGAVGGLGAAATVGDFGRPPLAGVLSTQQAKAGNNRRSPVPKHLPNYAYPLSLTPAAFGQMPLDAQALRKTTKGGALATTENSFSALAPLPPSSSSSSSRALESSKKTADSGGKWVWLIYHKSGRHDPRLMGVYTAARSALKNAKAVIDKETGGAERRTREGAELSDFSSNVQADQGVIYEVKHQNGGKNVVSFKKVRLNENLYDTAADDDVDDDVSDGVRGWRAPPSTGNGPALMGVERMAIGWM